MDFIKLMTFALWKTVKKMKWLSHRLGENIWKTFIWERTLIHEYTTLTTKQEKAQ